MCNCQNVEREYCSAKKKHKFCCNCIENELYLSVEYFFDGSICLRRDDPIPSSIVLRFRLVICVELRNQRKGHKQYVSECTDYIYIYTIDLVYSSWKSCFSEETKMFAVENLFARDFIAMNTEVRSECSRNNSLLFETGI